MSKSAAKVYYDDYWTRREGWTPHPALSSLQRRIFAQSINERMTVLDVGCGDGEHYGRWLATVAEKYHGLDVSQTAVDAARQNGILAERHDLTSAMPFPDATFDVVICMEVLEHLFDPAYTLGEIVRLLKPDGVVLMSVPNIAHFSNRIRMLLGGFSPGGTPETSSRRPWADPHIRFFTMRSFRPFVAEQGLKIVRLYGEGFSIFNSLPVVSSLAARLFGWKRLERWSLLFEFMARLAPSLCAGNFIAVARHRDV